MSEYQYNDLTMEEYERRKRERAKARELREKRRRLIKRVCIAVLAVIIIAAAVILITRPHKDRDRDTDIVEVLAEARIPSWIDKQIIASGASSRQGEKLSGMTAVVVHYVGSPGTSAQQNRDYYDQPGTKTSSHFIVGLDGEVIQCLPLDEKASATGKRNGDTISIEVCHTDENGEFTGKAYDSLVKLTAWLCKLCELDPDGGVIRHYDATGMKCPPYYVEHEDAWKALIEDVAAAMPKK